MDKALKVEIEKELEKLVWFTNPNLKGLNIASVERTTSSLTALIIKWLERKSKTPYKIIESRYNQEVTLPLNSEEKACNQLITELIGELR